MTLSAMEIFRAADRAYEQARQQWNALPDPAARHASGIDLSGLDHARRDAGRVLIAEAGSRHKIESQARVWLDLVDGRWTIDSDGESFEGYDDGPLNSECECDNEDECNAVLAAVVCTDQGIGPRELRDMLTEWLAEG